MDVCACFAEAQNVNKETPGKACAYFDWFHWVHNSRLSGVHIDQQVHVVVGERREEFDLHVRLFHQRWFPHCAVKEGSCLGFDFHRRFPGKTKVRIGQNIGLDKQNLWLAPTKISFVQQKLALTRRRRINISFGVTSKSIPFYLSFRHSAVLTCHRGNCAGKT